MALKATEQLVDTGTAAGKAFLNMFGVFVFAELESHLRRERQLEGISVAKARGLYKGREPSIDAAEGVRLRLRRSSARWLGISRASVYTLLGKGGRRLGQRGWECRSSLNCGGFIRKIGRKSAGGFGSSVPPGSARDAADHTA